MFAFPIMEFGQFGMEFIIYSVYTLRNLGNEDYLEDRGLSPTVQKCSLAYFKCTYYSFIIVLHTILSVGYVLLILCIQNVCIQFKNNHMIAV
jgi:hypothetical protein